MHNARKWSDTLQKSCRERKRETKRESPYGEGRDYFWLNRLNLKLRFAIKFYFLGNKRKNFPQELCHCTEISIYLRHK